MDAERQASYLQMRQERQNAQFEERRAAAERVRETLAKHDAVLAEALKEPVSDVMTDYARRHSL